jgi:putative phosphoribosyl transferase
MFTDRQQAGRQLGEELAALRLPNPVVLALPRGGVPVGAAIAAALDAPLDLLIVRKVGAPGNPELAAAAIVDGDPADVVLNREIIEVYGLSNSQLAALIKRERPELERRRMAYRGDRHPLSIDGKTAIVVDDGAATGTTMKVAIRALKHRSPREVVLALPVAPPETVAELALEADRIICLSQPVHFHALGYHYRSFPQLTDTEVTTMLEEFARWRKDRPRAARVGS